jgi:hypothetical protein
MVLNPLRGRAGRCGRRSALNRHRLQHLSARHPPRAAGVGVSRRYFPGVRSRFHRSAAGKPGISRDRGPRGLSAEPESRDRVVRPASIAAGASGGGLDPGCRQRRRDLGDCPVRRHQREDPVPPAGDSGGARGGCTRSRRRFCPRRGQPARGGTAPAAGRHEWAGSSPGRGRRGGRRALGVGCGTSRRSRHRQFGDRWTRVARGRAGRARHHGDPGACRRRSDHGYPACPAQKHRTPVRSRRGTAPARAGVDADVEAGLPRSDLHRPRVGHPRHQPPDRWAVADPDRRHVPGTVVLCAAGTHLPVARGHLPGGPGRAGDLESTGGAGAVEAVAFLARGRHPMDGPASGADGRRPHARSVGGGVRHAGVGVRGDLSNRESD